MSNYTEESKQIYNEVCDKYNHHWLDTTIPQKMAMEMITKALAISRVGNSSDLIVVELSDNEIKIINEQELKEWQKIAIEFDGFEAWTVKGRLVKNR